MRSTILAVIGAVAASTIATRASYGDFNLLVRPSDPVAVAGATPRSVPRQRAARRGGATPDRGIVALVDRVADETGVPRGVMHFHVRMESGYRPAARNPASTATGLLQPIRGSHAAIIGRPLTHAEHFALARDPEHNLRVGAAHIRACIDLMPGASAQRLWRACHVAGHGNVGGRIEMAAAHYQGRVSARFSFGHRTVAVGAFDRLAPGGG